MLLAYVTLVYPLLVTLHLFFSHGKSQKGNGAYLVLIERPNDYTGLQLAIAQLLLTIAALLLLHRIRSNYLLLAFCYIFFVLLFTFPLLITNHIYCTIMCFFGVIMYAQGVGLLTMLLMLISVGVYLYKKRGLEKISKI